MAITCTKKWKQNAWTMYENVADDKKRYYLSFPQIFLESYLNQWQVFFFIHKPANDAFRFWDSDYTRLLFYKRLKITDSRLFLFWWIMPVPIDCHCQLFSVMSITYSYCKCTRCTVFLGERYNDIHTQHTRVHARMHTYTDRQIDRLFCP